MKFSTEQKETIKRIVKEIRDLNGNSFAGVKAYTSKTSGEVADHTILLNWSYGNAVAKDLNALQCANMEDIKAIKAKGFSCELVIECIDLLKDRFIANQNKETASNQSKAQSDAYLPIDDGLKLHLETGKLHIYGRTIQKKVIVKGEYKKVNSREKTLCQNAIKKHFKFRTIKFRSYVVDTEQFGGLNMKGLKFEL